MAKLFTLREAEALLPKLEGVLRSAIEAKQEAERIDAELTALAARVMTAGGMEIDPVAAAGRNASKHRAVEKVKAGVNKIQQAGCLVKDLDVGLLDFPALLGEREVYLCWKLGEERIGYWHGVEEGFAGRKKIAGGFGESDREPRPN